MALQRILRLLALSLAGCDGASAGGEQTQDWQSDLRPAAQTLVYECPGREDATFRFTARLGPGEMAVWVDDRYLVLSRVRSASGIKYLEGDVLFWLKGEEALLNIGSRHYAGCRLVPARAPWEDARRRGVIFRAAGNEPGWYLEFDGGGHALYVGDYGTTRLEFPDTEQIRLAGGRILQATGGEHDLRVEIVEGLCVDTMQGDSYPARVVVQVDGKSLQGCGMELGSGRKQDPENR